MSHVEDRSSPEGFRTVVEHRPDGFRVEEDEDDPGIFRFYCAKDGLSADQ